MNRPALAAATIAVAAALSTITAPPAAAWSTATTTVTFGGTGCIEAVGAARRSAYVLSVPTWHCSANGVLTWDEYAPAGAHIGVDPIMGDADWIACTINDGWRTYSDFARRGDGTDVNCLRTAT